MPKRPPVEILEPEVVPPEDTPRAQRTPRAQPAGMLGYFALAEEALGAVERIQDGVDRVLQGPGGSVLRGLFSDEDDEPTLRKRRPTKPPKRARGRVPRLRDYR